MQRSNSRKGANQWVNSTISNNGEPTNKFNQIYGTKLPTLPAANNLYKQRADNYLRDPNSSNSRQRVNDNLIPSKYKDWKRDGSQNRQSQLENNNPTLNSQEFGQ